MLSALSMVLGRRKYMRSRVAGSQKGGGARKGGVVSRAVAAPEDCAVRVSGECNGADAGSGRAYLLRFTSSNPSPARGCQSKFFRGHRGVRQGGGACAEWNHPLRVVASNIQTV